MTFAWFTPLNGKSKERKLAAFDIEGGGGLGGFVCGAVVSDEGEEFYIGRAEMFERVKDLARDGYLVFAHNIGYDLPLLEGEDFPSGDYLYARGRLLWADYVFRKRRARVHDSTHLFPRHGVAALGDLVGLEKGSVGPATLDRLKSGEPWGHYHFVIQGQIQEYCKQDARILYRALALLQEILLELGGELKATIAGCSMDVFRRVYMKWPWHVLGKSTNKISRGAYYGGRTEAFAMGRVEGANKYDITSLYPWAMATTKFPHPGHLRLELYPRAAGEWLAWEGVCHATLEAPDTFIPLLPHRYDGRLFFPTGRMDGWWTLLEVRHAIKQGYRLLAVGEVLYSKVLFSPFREFVKALFAKRLGYLVDDMGRANLIKLLLNSLYGRFGLNWEVGFTHLVNLEAEFDWEAHPGTVSQEYMGQLVGLVPVQSDNQPAYVNNLFAAQITAAARLRLYQELERQDHQALYCDTDSIITLGKIETGEGLGAWRQEHAGITADLISPKEYALHGELISSSYHVKGVPAALQEQWIRTGVARFFRAITVLESLANGQQPTEWVETVRSKGQVLPKRAMLDVAWDGSPDWVGTEAFRAQELPFVSQGYHSRLERVWDFRAPVYRVPPPPFQPGLLPDPP